MPTVEPSILNALLARAAAHENAALREAAQLGGVHGLLPLYLDWMGFVGINAEGDFLFVGWEPPHKPDVAVPAYLRRVAIVAGADVFPELRDLIPSRPENAVVCGTCAGTGKPRLPPGTTHADHIRCYCGGLGWILPGEGPDPDHDA